jgi:hypothetical protein
MSMTAESSIGTRGTVRTKGTRYGTILYRRVSLFLMLGRGMDARRQNMLSMTESSIGTTRATYERYYQVWLVPSCQKPTGEHQ